MTRLTRAFVIVCVALGMAGMRVMPAQAAPTYTVTTCGSGTGPGTLPYYVGQANSDNANDIIDFGCSGTIPLSSTLTITSSMTIDGSGQQVTIDGGNSTRLFSVDSGVTLNLNHLTLSHGQVSCSTTFCNAFGGAVYNSGTVTITASTLSGNTASCSNTYCEASGGAIYSDGSTSTVTIITSTLWGNTASCSTTYCQAVGGAIYSGGSSMVTITTSTLSGNTASTSCTSTSITSPCIAYGGAIFNFGAVKVTTSTLSGNIVSCTADFCITSGGAMYGYGDVTIGGSIVAGNTSPNCSTVIVDEGYNLEDTYPSTCGFSSANHDLVGVDPMLGTLMDNGGPTQTMALRPGSPAIDYIPVGVANILCPAIGGTDQRGYPRPDSNEASCDIGAYEYQDTEFPTGTGMNAYDIESSNWYCTGGGSACVSSMTVASTCTTLAPCLGANYADAEAFGRPSGSSFGVPDELVLACVQGTSTGYNIGYLDVVSSQGTTDYPMGTRSYPGVYGNADVGVIGGKGTLIGGDGSEDNPSQTSSISASAYDLTTRVRGSVTGTQNTDNGANSLNNGSFRVTITGMLWHVTVTGNSPTYSSYSGTISCMAGGPHAHDLLNAGKDTNALAEGELEPNLGDNHFLQGLVPPRLC